MFQEIYQNPTPFIVGVSILAMWSLVWKGIALWFAGKNKQKAWFIFLLIFNTIGLLPIIYLLFFKKKSDSKKIHKEKVVEKKIVKKTEKDKGTKR